jgi:hypothetical protein
MTRVRRLATSLRLKCENHMADVSGLHTAASVFRSDLLNHVFKDLVRTSQETPPFVAAYYSSGAKYTDTPSGQNANLLC